jgi:predicted ATPase
VFEGIRDSYRDIFELVEDLYFEFDKSSNSYLLYQLEKGVAQPIRYDKLSSGMYKTLMLLTSLYTFRDGGILVIDEFENSFGANCIDEVVEVIKEFEDKFQFIITSHHPYIINNIPTGSWRVVGRKGREVMSRSARDFGIGATRHEAFLELVNLWKFDESVIV